ncbi:MAG TPA: T9SS type A sorting domain-containing protein, partial [Brumimicrobium sp.]|nr:T9SS type A sorting domain-containing protein [Brumimicrobium sp.]
VYDNADVKEPLTATGGSAYDNPDLVEIDLSSYIPAGQGEAVQLRFGWTTDYPGEVDPGAWITYGWVIDDIKIIVKEEYDLKFLSADHHFTNAQYAQIPTEQISEMEVRVAVYNLGSDDLTNIVLNLLEGTDVVATGTLAALAPSATDTVVLTYTPDNTLGVKTYTLEVEPGETDVNPGNNQIPYEIKINVNENTYAADKLGFGETANEYEFTVALTTGDQSLRTIGVLYDIYENRELSGIDVRFFAGAENEIVVGIEDVTDERILIAESDPYLLETTDIGVVKSIELSQRPTLTAGKTYRVFVNAFGNEDVSLVSSGTTSRADQILLEGQDGSFFYISNRYAIPVIRMNFDPTLNISSNELNELGLTQYPNPFSNETTVQFTLKDASEVSYTVVDVTGKVVATANEGQLMAGVNEITIDGSSFANGVYYLNLTAGNSNVTHKMVVNK